MDQKQAKLAVESVKKSLKHLIDEGYANVSYDENKPNDVLYATITMKTARQIHEEIENL